MRILVISLLLFLGGCSYFTPKPNLPTVLTSREQMWTIPKGVAFKAIQKPAYPTLTEFMVPDDDLKVIYAGNLLELEQEANNRAVKAAKGAKVQGALLGSIGSFLTLLAGLFAKNNLFKKKEEKE